MSTWKTKGLSLAFGIGGLNLDLIRPSHLVDESGLADSGGAGDDDGGRAAGEAHLGDGGRAETEFFSSYILLDNMYYINNSI